MQHRVVVFVHSGDLHRAEAASLPPKASVDQHCAANRERERTQPGSQQHRQLAARSLADVGDCDACGDQADDRPVACGYRHDRSYRRAQRPRVGLGERYAS